MMETIRVNMTPCEDIKTIHASQNDNEGREWGFELHNNGEKIDSSSISDQLVFKAYEGGTEQILPENTSTPTTSPFKGDIKYPQGLLTDQEFTYRESPTESDGLAFVDSIKGNTLVWNQLANVGTLSATASYNGYLNIGTLSFVANHKYLIKYHQDNTMASNTRNTLQVRFATVGQTATENATANAHLSQGDYSWLFNSTYTDTNTIVRLWVVDNNVAVSYSNIMIFDLTQMGLDISNPSDFTSLFSLPYYAYNQGTLLSFNGNGIKTVGKNLFNKEGVTTGGFLNQSGGINSSASYSYSDFIRILPNQNIVISGITNGGSYMCFYDGNKNFISSSQNQHSFPYTCNVNASYVRVSVRLTELDSCQIELGSTATSYEPYTESVLSLPISTYFPSGMKSAGGVYDELTPSKAITRIGTVDLGSLNWNYNSTNAYFTTNEISSLYKVPSSNLTVANIIDPKHTSTNANDLVNRGELGIAIRSNGTLMVKDTNYTDANAFKTAMNGVYLYYELATPTETSFTTASLVTENAEIPLSNEDGVLIGKCTEQLSSESGFFDAKIKLADDDGECYSNKIQLHIERSPQ